MNHHKRSDGLQNFLKPIKAHHLDRLEKHRLCNSLTIFTPSKSQISQLMDRAREDIEGLASNEAMQRVAALNPDCIWAIRRKKVGSLDDVDPRGLAAF
ncbi:hypothetical protein KA005_60580, partial [bacterium]|nr:hypothetical protein [bacterium]